MSGNIHKRVRHYGETKIYRCYRCANEFDTPFMGPKESKTGDGNEPKTEESDR